MDSLTRAERRKLQTYDLLKNATTALLAEHGYANLSIRGITERADVGYGTFYLHFADKDEAVWAVLHDWIASWTQDLMMRLQHEVFPRKEYLSWVFMFEQLALNRENFLDVFGQNGSPKLLERYQQYMVSIYETNLIVGNYSANLDLPAEFLAQVSVGATIRLMLWWANNQPDYSPTAMAQLLFRTVYRQDPPE